MHTLDTRQYLNPPPAPSQIPRSTTVPHGTIILIIDNLPLSLSLSLSLFPVPRSYGIIYEHGYQDVESPVSVVATKVKGAHVVREPSADWMDNCPSSPYNWSILDHTDLVVPPQVSSY